MIDKPGLVKVLLDIAEERYRQDEKWGSQRHPNGTGGGYYQAVSQVTREECQRRNSEGKDQWDAILLEEVYEALAESDEKKLEKELVQVAAVAAVWIEDIRSRR